MSDDARRDGRHGRMGDDPTTTTHDDPRAAADRLRGEWEYDYLVQLAARAEMRREDSPFYTDAALVGWLDRESRAPERAPTGWSAEQVAGAAERLRARAEAARLGVVVSDAPPPLREAAVVGTVPQVMEEASRARCAPALALSAAAGAGRELWDEPCDEWLALPHDATAGEYVAIKVSGDSMTPLFLPGDMILVRMGGRIESDTVVVARHPDDGYVVKRVGRVGRTSLVLTSLNPAFAPMTVPRARNAVVGTVPQVMGAASAARCAPALALAAAAGSGRELWDEPCDQWVTLPADAGAGEFVAVKVSGDSMTPLFLPGDMILVRIGQRVERDTVVVARHPDDGYVVKRVGRVGRTSLVLTSLNPAFAPVTVPRAGNAVVGTVVMCWRGSSAAANRVSSSGT